MDEVSKLWALTVLS